MHSRIHHFHTFLLIAALGVIAIAVSCTSDKSDPTATTVVTSTPIIDNTPRRGAADRQPWPAGQPIEQSEWVKDRLAVMKSLYGFTSAGEEWIDGYDLRQMVEQPAWFGSFGYASWAGAGEAVPRTILHEMSHSYWGAFSVEGQPALAWSKPTGESEAILAYRDALAEFMRQPPDRFEPLRDRFRNFPGLDVGEYPDLHHSGEANLLYMTGGNYRLIPPILRPFYSGYLSDDGIGAPRGEQVSSWADALAWFAELDSGDRRVAGELFGLNHFPTAAYSGLPGTEVSGLDDEIRTLYEQEERQRLSDFADQVDGIINREFSLADATGLDRGFDFWKSYLSDKLALHGRYPELLDGLGTEKSEELSNALEFYSSIAHLDASEQAERFARSQGAPMVAELAVLLKPRAIVELFSESQSGAGIASVLGSRAGRLESLVNLVDEVASVFESSGSSASAAILELYVFDVPDEQFRSDAFLLLDLLRSQSRDLASSVLPQLSDEALVYVLEVQPAFARQREIGTERLLSAVGITPGSALQEITGGAWLLSNNSSGNFALDAPYDSAVFEILNEFADADPRAVLNALDKSGMRLLPWISDYPKVAEAVFSAELNHAARLLRTLDGSRETPWRVIHLVAKSNPQLAADLTYQFELVSEQPDEPNRTVRTMERAIREFGYDLYWFERNAGPGIDPERFGEFILSLDELVPDELFVRVLKNVFQELRDESASDVIEHDAGVEMIRTWEAAIDAHSGQDAERLRRLAVASIGFS